MHAFTDVIIAWTSAAVAGEEKLRCVRVDVMPGSQPSLAAIAPETPTMLLSSAAVASVLVVAVPSSSSIPIAVNRSCAAFTEVIIAWTSAAVAGELEVTLRSRRCNAW